MRTSAPGAEVREPLLELETGTGRSVPVATHADWADRFPWLVQGTTTRGTAAEPFDMGLAGSQPVATALGRWWALRDATAALAAVLARQVHGRKVLAHDRAGPGLHLMPPADGHHTDEGGTVLAVTVADCVPVFIVADAPRGVTLLHAGWRGTAAGILEAGLAAAIAAGARVDRLHVHFGPAICGACYEVGQEVHDALGLPVPDVREPIDLRSILADRAIAAGVAASRISRSAWCTRCDNALFFSHRAGDAGRQVGYLGIRGDA